MCVCVDLDACLETVGSAEWQSVMTLTFVSQLCCLQASGGS